MKRIALFLTSMTLAAAAAAAAPAGLVSHRATYEVTLSSTKPGGVVAVRGRTVLEFRDACSGWTTTQRFIADMTDAKGEDAHTDFIVSSSEDKPGKIIRFKIRNLVNGKITQRFEGTGTLAAAGGEVKLSNPRGQRFSLPIGTLLPTQHALAVLHAAATGVQSFHETVFQGGDSTDLYDTTTVIGRPSGSAQRAEDRLVDSSGLLNGVSAWPTLISYFPHGSTDEGADYEVAYRLYSNGVIAAMSLIYPNFTMKAELTRLEPLAAHC